MPPDHGGHQSPRFGAVCADDPRSSSPSTTGCDRALPRPDLPVNFGWPPRLTATRSSPAAVDYEGRVDRGGNTQPGDGRATSGRGLDSSSTGRRTAAVCRSSGLASLQNPGRCKPPSRIVAAHRLRNTGRATTSMCRLGDARQPREGRPGSRGMRWRRHHWHRRPGGIFASPRAALPSQERRLRASRRAQWYFQAPRPVRPLLPRPRIGA